MRSTEPLHTIVALTGILCLSRVCFGASLTVYNGDFAVVRESLTLDLKPGINEVKISNITAQLEPDSVILRDLQGKRAIQVLEQNYRADPVSEGLLLSLYEGKTIEFLGENGDIKSGKIIRSGYTPQSLRIPPNYHDDELRDRADGYGQPVIEVDGRVRFSFPGKPLFPALADDTILEPTLRWVLNTDQGGPIEAELSYVTGGMRWKADYNLLTTDDSEATDVMGWITLSNECGRTFEDARIKLMAGDISKVRQARGPSARLGGGGLGGAFTLASVTEKTFEDYHLYTLARSTTLQDRETKQVEFLRAEGVKSKRLYVYDGAQIGSRFRYTEANRRNRGYGSDFDTKVSIFKEFINSQDNHLGIPLPAGTVRFYRQDDDGQLEFIGENRIDHTPKDETVRLYTGNAFDLVGERRQTDYRIDTDANSLEESFEIKVRNRKENETVEIRIVEHLYRWSTWEIQEAFDDFQKTDGRTIEFRVQVPAGGEKVLTYKAHYTW